MKLCLITSNIRFNNPADGTHAWENRRQFLASTLLSHNPDIIATQEGRFEQLKDLESLLTGFKLVDHHRSWIGERMYPTFFVREDKFEIIKSEDLWLSETPEIAASRSFESTFPRLMTWMCVQPKNIKQKLFFVNTHLDHIKTDTRVSQVKVLLNETLKFWNKNSPLVIMGDFNDHPESEVRKCIEKIIPDLQDTWKLFHAIEETSHHGFKGEHDTGTRIDWILTDKKFSVETCEMEKISNAGIFPSDHFPIVCKLSL